jgi:hypothetical protein
MKYKIEIIGDDVYIPITKTSTYILPRSEAMDLANGIITAMENENSNQEDLCRS